MPDTTDIIAAQVQAATAGEIETPDAPDVEATPEDGAAAPAEGDATTEPSEPAPTPDEVEAALEAEGIKQRTDGRGENRIPYSRVKKMTEGMRKKLTEAHQAELKAERDKYASFSEFQEKANKLAYLDQLATHNPKAYLELLASANPAYRQFLEQRAEEQAAVPTNDPMPPPDARFPDGSEGYTITQQQKKDEWLLRRAEERAFKRYQKDAEERFGPIAKEWQAGKAIEAQRPAVQQRLAALNQTWGKELIDKHEAEIVQAMRANPNLTAELVVAQVLLPKVREDQTAMKTRIVKELNARPAAAVRQAPAAVTASEKEGDGRPKSTEDTIRAELQRVGMLR